MRILVGNAWRDGYLDEARLPGTCRVEVLRWVALEPVDGLFFVRPFSLRYLWRYATEIGLKATLRKVRSRWAERHRNMRWFSVGVGRILEPAEGQEFSVGSLVVFVAPAQPKAMERVVLHGLLI